MTRNAQILNGQDKVDHRKATSAKPGPIGQVPVEAIETDRAARLINPGAVDELTESMRAVGQINPILVMKAPDGRFNLIAGHHRLAAARKLGWEKIDAKVVDVNDIDREILQIDENLIRSELTELELAEHLVRRKKLFDSKGGEKIRTPGGKQKIGFDKATAAKIGRSKSSIQKARKRAAAISPEVREAIRRTPVADKGTELDALAAMPKKDQKRAAELYTSKKVKSIREARTRIEAKRGPSQEEKDEQDFQGIRRTWEKSGPGGQRKFDAWRAEGQAVANGASDTPKEAPVPPTSACATSSSPNGSADDTDQAPVTESADGQVHFSAGNIDVNRMRKNDLLRFTADNGINIPGFERKTIPAMKEALAAHIQSGDAPEGGWKTPEADRP